MYIAEKNDPQLSAQFFAATTHEIRTPLQTIVGTLELLEETSLNTEQMEYVRQIQFSSGVLLSLVNDILDFSKIQSGKLDIEEIPMNVSIKTEQVVDLICIEAHNKGLEVVIDIDDNIPSQILGDPIRIQQVLLNLIKNAVKFTESGYVHIRLSLRYKGRLLLFEVTDSGIGIPAEKQQKLFSAFYQTDSSTSRRYGGTGLGLSISKKLVTLMGGKIGMKPNPAGGAMFWFTVPLKSAKMELYMQDELNEVARLVPLLDIPPDTSVLIVDDQAIALRSLYAKLRRLDIPHIDTALSGQDALIQMRKAAKEAKPYALVLIDMLMPDMDGWRLSSKIHNDSSINTVPLYLMVPEGQMGGEAKMKLLDWFTGYLYKPVKFRMLQEILALHFTSPVDRPAVKAADADTSAEKSCKKTFSVKGLRILIAEDHPINQKLLLTFLTQFEAEVFTASNGEEAIKQIQVHPDIDLIFMDIQMPVKSGLEAAAELRSASYTGPIIACTANTDASDYNQYLNEGISDLLSKPFKRQDVQDILFKWLPSLE